MKVIENYLHYKTQITLFQSNLDWVEIEINSVKGSGSSGESQGKVKPGAKLDHLISKKTYYQEQLKKYTDYVNHVDSVLDILEEKYKTSKDYEMFVARYFQKKSLRMVAKELHSNRTCTKDKSEQVMEEFESLTKILADKLLTAS